MSDKTEGIKIEDGTEERVKAEQAKAEGQDSDSVEHTEGSEAAGENGCREGEQEAGGEGCGSSEAEGAGSSEAEGSEKGEAEEAGTAQNNENAGEDEPDDSRYLRLLAEFQNYKKRVEKEKSDLYSYANEKIMTELLEVLDNFERALEQGGGDGFEEGMKLIFTQLTNVLEKSGLAEIAALGEEFDPNVHNAVMTEDTEEYESGKVSGVLQKGYTLNGKVIRPTMVKVAN